MVSSNHFEYVLTSFVIHFDSQNLIKIHVRHFSKPRYLYFQDGNSTVVSQASKKGSHNDRFYEEYEYERKLKKRKARLVSAAEEAFTHIKRMQSIQQSKFFRMFWNDFFYNFCFFISAKDKSPMESYEAAQAIFPTLSRPLQKYLRITRQQPRHSVESILTHLSTCLSYDLSPRAFLEKYIINTPVLQVSKPAQMSQNNCVFRLAKPSELTFFQISLSY